MSGILSSLQGMLGNLGSSIMGLIDKLFPPEKRAEVIAKLQAFATSNPKLAAFLLTNIALTGFPLVMFIVFTITVFVFSLVAALLIGLLVALLFTVFMVGVALLFVLPTIFLTTMASSFLFLWGLGGYYILKWFNEGDSPGEVGDAIGDKLNSLTGGRMNFLMDGARKKEMGGIPDGKAKTAQPKSEKPKDDGKVADNSDSDAVRSANQAKDHATKSTNGTPKKLNKAAGGATGT